METKLTYRIVHQHGFLLPLFIILALAATVGNVTAQIKLVDVGYASNTNNGGNALGIVVSNGYAYLANGSDGLCVFDIANPTNPVLTGHATVMGPSDALALSGGFAYVASGTNGLAIYNISNPSNVVLAGHINSGVAFSSAGGVAVSGHYVYLADSTAGLCIFDVSSPAAPVKVAETNEGAANSVFISGNYAYVSCGIGIPGGVTNALIVNDISDPTNPIVVARVAGTRGTGAGLAVSGNLLYLAQKTISIVPLSGGLSVFDISSPTATRYLGGIHAAEPSAVKVLGDYVFLAAGANGLIVFETTGGTNLVSIGEILLPGGVGFGDTADVAISGSYAYVANGTDGLRVCAMVPSLSVQVSEPNSLLFSWLTPASCALQQNSDPTSTNWSTLTNIPVALGPTSQVTLSAPTGNMFYRLISQ